MTKEDLKESIFRALRKEFDSIQDEDRLKEIYETTKALGYVDEAEEMHNDLVVEGIINPY
jgi:hypothetical protein